MIYQTGHEGIRAKTSKGNIWKDALMIRIQVRYGFTFLPLWATVRAVHIEFRGKAPIHTEWPRLDPMKLGNSYGDKMEVWFIDTFNVDERIKEMVDEYLSAVAYHEEADNLTKTLIKEVV